MTIEETGYFCLVSSALPSLVVVFRAKATAGKKKKRVKAKRSLWSPEYYAIQPALLLATAIIVAPLANSLFFNPCTAHDQQLVLETRMLKC